MKVEIWGIYDPNEDDVFLIEGWRWKFTFRNVTIISETFYTTERGAKTAVMRFLYNIFPIHRPSVKFVHDTRSNIDFLV